MLISIIIPLKNEAENLPLLYARLVKVMTDKGFSYEIVFINDGSTDNSLAIIQELAKNDKQVRYISFSRNFGHEAATTAGIDIVKGDAAVIIDADLQDPPEIIPEFIACWQEGAQIVYGRRRVREGEPLFRRLSAWTFYRLLRRLSDIAIPVDTGDFRLMDRAVIDSVKLLREQSRFVRGLITWVGYRQRAVEYERDPRASGKSGYNPVRLLMLSLDAITGFSIMPLRMLMVLGLGVTCLSFLGVLWIIFNKLYYGLPIPGYAFQTSGLFFLGGTQILFLGILGEYIGKIYRQVQKRPLYVIDSHASEF